MCKENAGAECCNKRGRQLKHWRSPHTAPVSRRDKSSASQDGFVAPEKWFRRPGLKVPQVAQGRSGSRGLRRSNRAALEPFNGNEKVRPVQYLDQPVEDHPLIIAGSRQEVFL